MSAAVRCLQDCRRLTAADELRTSQMFDVRKSLCAVMLLLLCPSADEEVEAEELNPFSFREFLRWKNQDPDLEQVPEQDLDQEQTHREVLNLPTQRATEEEEEEVHRVHYSCLSDLSVCPQASSSQRLFDVVTFDPVVRTGFFLEPSLAPQVV